MEVKRLTLGRSDKLSLPGVYESTGASLGIEIELQPGEDTATALAEAKVELDRLYWWLAASIYNEALARIRTGTPAFLLSKNPSR